MLQFTIGDLARALQDRNPDFSDMASFGTRLASASKQALADYFANLRTNVDQFARSSTLSAGSLTTGSAVFSITGSGSVFRIAMGTGMLSVAGDSIFVEGSTSTFINVPRGTIESILTSGASATTEIFWENNGEIVLYSKTGDFTPPATVHCDYWRLPSITTNVPQATVATVNALAANTYNETSTPTLTANANGALVIDGYTVTTADIVDVRFEVVGLHNGLYSVTQVGDASHPYILTKYQTQLDIKPEDFTSFVDSVYSYMTES